MENKRGGEIVGAVVVFFILLFVYAKFVGPIPFTVNNINTNKTSPFEVSGTGRVSAAPSMAVLNLGITQSGTDVLSTQQKTNETAKEIINSLKDLGIPEKDIKTINYSINPNYSFSGETQRITGYSVTQNLEVEVPIDKTNQAVDSATKAGANLVGNISFKLESGKEQKLINQARKEAVKKAKDSAEGLAKASGIRLGKIINVRESFGGEPIPLARGAVGVGLEQKTNITPGESNIEVTVTLTYETF